MSNPDLKQIYDGNPSTTLPDTALLYSFLPPYGSTDSTGISIGDLKKQFSNETDITVSCPFNVGSPVGTTDFTAVFTFRKVGNLVTVLIPAVGFNIVNFAAFRTVRSANPNFLPAALTPSKTSYGFITTNSNGLVPEGSPGSFEVTFDRNINIYFQNTNGGFPVGFWGGTGFSQIGDNRIQLMTYSLN